VCTWYSVLRRVTRRNMPNSILFPYTTLFRSAREALTKLEEIGEFVSSASSTIEPPVVKRLRAEFAGAAPAEKTKPAAKSQAKKPAAPKKPAEPKAAEPKAAETEASAEQA